MLSDPIEKPGKRSAHNKHLGYTLKSKCKCFRNNITPWTCLQCWGFNYKFIVVLLQVRKEDNESQSAPAIASRVISQTEVHPRLPAENMVPQELPGRSGEKQTHLYPRALTNETSSRQGSHHSMRREDAMIRRTTSARLRCSCTGQTTCWEHLMKPVPFQLGSQLNTWHEIVTFHQTELQEFPQLEFSLDLDSFIYDSSTERSVITMTDTFALNCVDNGFWVTL